MASNPFDDTPPQSAQNPMMHGGPPHMHPHHSHHMGGPPMRGMSPLTPMGGMSPMMPHNMGNMSPMGNSPMSNHISHMGGMSPMNHAPMGGMSPMNNMGPSMPPGPMNSMNNHMNMGHMGNAPMSGPPMGSPMNSGPMGSPMNMGHSMGSPMGGPLGSPMNSIGGNNHNHMPNGPININNINSHMPPNSPLNGPPMNNVNSPLNHNGSQPHPNHMGNNLSNLGRPMNGPMTNMSSMAPNNMNMSGPNSMGNMNMGGPPMNNMSNMNMPHPNQMGHMGGPMGGMGNNMSGGPPMGHPMGMAGNMPPHGFQGPPGMGAKPMPVSAGKVRFIPQWGITFLWFLDYCHGKLNWLFYCRYIPPINQWSSTLKIQMHHQFIRAVCVTKKYMITIREFFVSLAVISGFTGELFTYNLMLLYCNDDYFLYNLCG